MNRPQTLSSFMRSYFLERLAIAMLVTACALTASAQSAGQKLESIRFDPAVPVSDTPFAIHISASHQLSCQIKQAADATVSGNVITVTAHAVGCLMYPPPLDGGWFHAVAIVPGVPAGVYTINVSLDFQGGQSASLGTTTLPVRDAAPPFEVRPNVGTGWGGERIRLMGTGVATCAAAPCADPVVRFGNAVAQRVAVVSPDEIDVDAPSPGGIVDVTIERAGLPALRSVAAYDDIGIYGLVGDRNAQRTFFEPVLLPVLFSGAGAYGSQWQSDVSVYNGNEYVLFGAFQVMSDPVYASVPGPHDVYELRAASGWPQGRLVEVPRQAAPNVNFGLMVRDTTRQAQDLGTELPVVRERDMHDGPFSILNVPTDPRYRLHLRVYGIDYVRSVWVTIESIATGSVLVSNSMSLDRVVDAPGRHMLTQGAVVDLLGTYPQLAGKGPLRVEIYPSGARAWAFITVTNNDTQHVTVIAPE